MSFKARVQELAFETVRDPKASPDDRAEARAALVGDTSAMTGTELFKLVHKTMTPDDRAAIRRLAELVATPGYEYHPPPPICFTAREHIEALLELDPDQRELARLISEHELEEQRDQR